VRVIGVIAFLGGVGYLAWIVSGMIFRSGKP
jgi:hypothetical protein